MCKRDLTAKLDEAIKLADKLNEILTQWGHDMEARRIAEALPKKEIAWTTPSTPNSSPTLTTQVVS